MMTLERAGPWWPGSSLTSLNPAPFAEGAAHEFDDQVKGSDAYHTVDLADDEFTVQWLVLLNATSKELERDLAHETLHALHDSNKITRKEWEAVTHPALIDAWAAQYEIATRYSESPAGHQRQEAVAERFGEAVARGSQRSQKEGSAVAPVRQGPGGRGGLGEWIALGDLPGEDKVDPAVLQAAQDVFRLAANGRIGRRRTRLAERGALTARAWEADDPAEEAELLRQAEKIDKAIRADDYADRRAQEEWMAQGRPPPPGADTDGKDG